MKMRKHSKSANMYVMLGLLAVLFVSLGYLSLTSKEGMEGATPEPAKDEKKEEEAPEGKAPAGTAPKPKNAAAAMLGVKSEPFSLGSLIPGRK